jgi:hypothetical protein
MDALQRYLRETRTKSASLLAERPVVVVWPVKNRGRIIWDARTNQFRQSNESLVGTKRTNRAGLMMSVDRGRPEVAGRGSNRRD